ncbi:MAG: hypothetical protein H7235_02775 [Bdellovibrionaceae bacterium]|nr:hypothetical protein [Pseudobdellovibrionaceae bacterium]
MKMLTLVCIIAISAVATAQTATPTTTATTTAKAKKAAKKAKLQAADTAINTTETSATSAKTASEVSASVPVVGTSTTVTTPAPATKTFAGFVISDTSADQSGMGGASGSNNIQSVTNVGGSYQLTNLTKVSIAQAFETASNGMYHHQLNNKLDNNNFRPMYVEPAINTLLTNFLGTDRTKVDFRARLNNTNALWNEFGGAAGVERHYQISSNSMKALTPQFALTMYNEARVYQYTDNSAVGTRISLLPGAGYAINDQLSFYQIAGFIMNTKDGESLTNKRERVYLETGLNYAPAALSGLNINLLAFQDKMVASQVATEKVSSLDLYSANNNKDGTSSNDAVAYEAIINYNF